MKKIIWILLLTLLLTSCWMTQEEKLTKIKECEELGWQVYIWSSFWTHIDCNEKEDKVLKCIKEYTNWLNEKYNNPDTVSNLREDNYSQVVKICNEIFWDK